MTDTLLLTLRTAATALVLLLATGCVGEQDQPAVAGTDQDGPRATPVIVQAVALVPERTRLEAVGTSRARRSVVLHPATAGEVTAVRFAPGQRVAAGAVLLELDARAERLAVELAQVRLAEAERLYRRYRDSKGSGAVTQSDLDGAHSAQEAARIELHQARVALDDRSLEAPFAGHVGSTDIDAGARVGPDTAVTSLDDRSVLLVRFEVPETLIGRLRLGDEVTVAPWTTDDAPVRGRLVDIGSRIDPVSRTFEARAEVANDADRLRPGMSFRVVLELTGRSYPVVPEVAVQWGGDGAFVWRVENGKAHRLPVRIVQRHTGRVLVDADLTEGALVVHEGVQRMREGMAVRYFEG